MAGAAAAGKAWRPHASMLLPLLLALLPIMARHGLSEAAFLGFGVDRVRRFAGHGRYVFQHHHEHVRHPGREDEDPVVEDYFTGAVVDNFAARDLQRPWHSGQRFFFNTKHWGGDSYPIFFMIGGEGPESKASVTDRWYFYQLAEQHQALLVCLEHRYYGKSFPTPDMSTHHLRHLSSAQALADLARFIPFFKEKMNAPNSNVITFGGSYPGNLAAWFRLKYPHLTRGSVASSAPVRAVMDYHQYMEVVSDALTYFGGWPCRDALARAVNATAAKMQNQEYARLAKDFQLCSPVETARDLWVLQTNLMGNIQGVVQYNAEREGSITVTDVCEALLDGQAEAAEVEDEELYRRFVDLSNKFLPAVAEGGDGPGCMEVSYAETLAEMRNATFDGFKASRQWYYQTCNEFGYFQTISSPLSDAQPFAAFETITLDSYLALCRELFHDFRAVPTRWTNTYYGELDVAATRVVFPSGTIDPWHALGVTNSTPLANPMEGPVFILGTAHCHDMHAPNPETDPPSLTWARKQIAEAVARWVKIGAHKKRTVEEAVLASKPEATEEGKAGPSSSSSSSSWLLALGSLCLGTVVGAAISLLVVGTNRRRKGLAGDRLPVSEPLGAPLLQVDG